MHHSYYGRTNNCLKATKNEAMHVQVAVLKVHLSIQLLFANKLAYVSINGQNSM